MKRITTLALVFAVTVTPLAYSQVLFEEDFEQYASIVGTGDRSAMISNGWQFEAAMGAHTSPYTEVTVEWNLELSRGGLSKAINSTYRRNKTVPDQRGNADPETIFLISDHDAYDGAWTDPRTGIEYSSENANLLHGTGQSYDAITPSIDCSGVSQVWLHFDAAVNLNNNGAACFVVDVKAGDGPWVNKLFRAAPARFPGEQHSGTPGPITENFTTPDYDFPTEGIAGKDGNQGGLHGRVHLDLSDVAAGQSDVRIRFRHYESHWDWWCAINNIVVDVNSAPRGAEVIFGPEEFENGIPSNWTLNQTLDTVDNAWTDREGEVFVQLDVIDNHYGIGGTMRYKDGESLNRLAGQGYAIYASIPELSIPVQQDGFIDDLAIGTLDTPVIDCSEYEEVFLYCWAEFLPGNIINADTGLRDIQYFIEYSADGGETFDVLFDFNQGLLEQGEGSRAQEYYLPIPEAAGQSQVIVRFKGVGAHNSGDVNGFFAVDDVTVTGNREGTTINGWSLF